MTVSFNFKLSNYIRTHTQSNVIKIITTLHLSSIHIRPLLSNTQVQIFFTRNFLKTVFGKNYKSISSIFVLSLISIYKEGNRQHLLQLFGYWRVKYECCKQKKGTRVDQATQSSKSYRCVLHVVRIAHIRLAKN